MQISRTNYKDQNFFIVISLQMSKVSKLSTIYYRFFIMQVWCLLDASTEFNSYDLVLYNFYAKIKILKLSKNLKKTKF